jgi:dynein heavy chain
LTVECGCVGLGVVCDLQVMQLHETTLVRHGLMLVGPTMAGKTCCYKVLARALTALQAASEAAYERVRATLVVGCTGCLGCLQ